VLQHSECLLELAAVLDPTGQGSMDLDEDGSHLVEHLQLIYGDADSSYGRTREEGAGDDADPAPQAAAGLEQQQAMPQPSTPDWRHAQALLVQELKQELAQQQTLLGEAAAADGGASSSAAAAELELQARWWPQGAAHVQQARSITTCELMQASSNEAMHTAGRLLP